ncbi:unnamed protein product (macronuclear) [Paramecium tetraurelia]|uniref:RBR-type E3 ubiquitin transferase n=1 Tax=Paramecium tetraurelia TaxID=5888 RepID=A0D0L2_PARTE|nr:uncharacterized protein GSPATT00012131001 [Paramecium tetraurelia]CAK76579.1 unnamed protein product [Paramecium tetraurelia]|eukprot:XP_001443976.1 hypothetical protein (macronuclear) [Paramecium tetraurelia strain d4-2]
MVDCNICYCNYKEEECYTLPNCLHQFCKSCLSEQLKTKIQSQQIDLSDFKCPQCGRLFNPEIIEHFLSPELYKKYCDYAFQFNKIMGLEDNELLTNCLNEKCIEKFIIWKDAEYMQCPSCKMKFCRKCQLEYHADKGISCEQQKELHKDQFYIEMKKNLKICRCPKCNNMCEKISGCNFMYCRCKTNFCFLCDVELTEAYHSSHFQKNDPYNSPCRVWYNGTWVDPDKVPKVEPVKEEAKVVQVIPVEEKENKFPCPNCGSKNKDVSQLQFFDKVVQCQSVKCQNSTFCISCQKSVSNNDIIGHFNQQTLLCKFK